MEAQGEETLLADMALLLMPTAVLVGVEDITALGAVVLAWYG